MSAYVICGSITIITAIISIITDVCWIYRVDLPVWRSQKGTLPRVQLTLMHVGRSNGLRCCKNSYDVEFVVVCITARNKCHLTQNLSTVLKIWEPLIPVHGGHLMSKCLGLRHLMIVFDHNKGRNCWVCLPLLGVSIQGFPANFLRNCCCPVILLQKPHLQIPVSWSQIAQTLPCKHLVSEVSCFVKAFCKKS